MTKNNIFSLGISVMKDYYRLARESKAHAVVFTLLVIVIVGTACSPFLLVATFQKSRTDTGSVAAIPTRPAAQPAKSAVPPSMSRAKHAATRKSNVTQIALGAQNSNINEVDRDLTINNYGVAAGQSLPSVPEVKK